MLEKLWNDIRLIHEGLNFNSRLLIDDLMIISQDNHYLLYYKQNEISTQIRIEKNLSLVNMWSDSEVKDITYYNIHVEVGDQIYTSENSMIELTYKIITPFIRDCKLNKIGV
jgi:hypothetical protein